MNILLVSGTGFLGKTLLEGLGAAGFSVAATARNGSLSLDLEQPVAPQLEATLAKAQYTHGIICAAVTDVEECIRHPDRSQRLNVDATKELLDLFKKFSIRPVFFSSDLVFANTQDFYKETDQAIPSTLYGKQKLTIEEYIRAEFVEHLIFRTSKLMSLDMRPRGILASTILSLQRDEEIKAFTDQYITPVFIEDVTRAVALALKAELQGTFHLAVRERTSRLELAQLVARELGFSSPKIKPITMQDLKFSETRGTKYTIDATKIEQALGSFRFMSVEEGLRAMKAKL